MDRGLLDKSSLSKTFRTRHRGYFCQKKSVRRCLNTGNPQL